MKHWLAVARNKLSPPPVFRSALAELGRLLIYEATAQGDWLPVLEGQAETPCGVADVAFLDPGRPVKARFTSLSVIPTPICRTYICTACVIWVSPGAKTPSRGPGFSQALFLPTEKEGAMESV